MNELIAELQRLYFPQCATTTLAAALAAEGEAAMDPVAADGRVTALVISLDCSLWAQAAHLCEQVQDELGLPAPAVSVSGGSAYGLWFSVAEAVPRARAVAFLESLRRRYLAEVPAARLSFHPPAPLSLVPACQGADRWSAYIDPSLGSMFVTEPWLEMAPSPQKQAELLVGQTRIKPADFDAALALLEGADSAGSPAASAPSEARVSGRHDEPVGFLLAIMNDDAIETRLRIEAAKALLPYFRKPAA